jgi:flagellar hook-length control protein FliK
MDSSAFMTFGAVAAGEGRPASPQGASAAADHENADPFDAALDEVSPSNAPAADKAEEAEDRGETPDIVTEPEAGGDPAAGEVATGVPPASPDAVAMILESWSGISAQLGGGPAVDPQPTPQPEMPGQTMGLIGESSTPALASAGAGQQAKTEAGPLAQVEAGQTADPQAEGDANRPSLPTGTGDAPILRPERSEQPGTAAIRAAPAAPPFPDMPQVEPQAVPATPAGLSDTPRGIAAQPDWRPAHLHPQAVIRQIADAVVTTRDDRIEIALSPEELGRVRLVVTGSERAPHVTVWVERPEVMDLIRRNAAMLQNHFDEAGLNGAALEFREEGRGRKDHPDRNATDLPDAVPAAEMSGQIIAHAVRLGSATMAGDRRIDIRL